MYECHGHIAMDGINYKSAMERHVNVVDEAFVRQNLKTCADYGISFFRDGGDKYMVSAFAKRIASEYGIDYRTPVFAIHKKGYYGDIVGRSFENMNDFASLVKEAKANGADFIKLMVSGILNFKSDGSIEGPALSYPEIREAINIAGSEGFKVMAHVNGAGNIENALEAGIMSVEHGFWPENNVIDAFLETGAVWVPTCSTVNNIIGCSGFPESVLKNILHKQTAVLKEAYSKGVNIACGSDSGAFMVPHGKGAIDEMNYLSSLGIDTEKGNIKIKEIFKIS